MKNNGVDTFPEEESLHLRIASSRLLLEHVDSVFVLHFQLHNSNANCHVSVQLITFQHLSIRLYKCWNFASSLSLKFSGIYGKCDDAYSDSLLCPGCSVIVKNKTIMEMDAH